MSDKGGRYELKFVLDNSSTSDVYHWLNYCTSIKNKYPGRLVNSLYFDDVYFQSVKDNLAGISNRKKTRLRWYQADKNSINSIPNLEFKVRDGRLGYKKSLKMDLFNDSLYKCQIRSIVLTIKNYLKINNDFRGVVDDYLLPTLQVQYFREYYEDHRGIRITIDSNIKFSGVNIYKRLSNMRTSSSYPYNIMEIKFDPLLKDEVSDIIRQLHITPKRSSKYLTGMSVLGYAVYI